MKITVLLFAVPFVLAVSGCGAASERPSSQKGTGTAAPASAGGPRTDSRSEANLHPAFSLSLEDLGDLVSGLPEDIRDRILSDPEGFLESMESVLREPRELLVLVDKKHPLPEGYVPGDLVLLEEYGVNVNRRGLELRKAALEEFLKMKDAARTAGFTIPVISAYRSYEYQVKVYANHVATYGREAAERESAAPGKSQHQLGTALDLGNFDDDFGTTPLGRWLRENAWKYGFSLSYPEGESDLTGYKYEPWHYRYVGRAAAETERTHFGGIQQHFLQFYDDASVKLRSALKK